MCTLSWLPQPGGHLFWHGRDERTTRAPGVPPSLVQRRRLSALAPRDPDAGGTWVGVNELGDRFGVIGNNEASFAGFTNVPYAAVVHGYQTPLGHAQSGTWWRHDSTLASLGAFASLLYGHVQVSALTERALDEPSTLAKYKVLYMAGGNFESCSPFIKTKQET